MCSYFGGVCLVSATRGTRDYTLPKRSLGLGDHNLSSLYFISNTGRRRLWTQRLFSVYLGTDNRILSLGSISNCPVGHSWVITVLNKAGKHIKGKRQNRSIWFSCRTKTHDNRPGRVQFSVILLKINPSPASNPTKCKLIFFSLFYPRAGIGRSISSYMLYISDIDSSNITRTHRDPFKTWLTKFFPSKPWKT